MSLPGRRHPNDWNVAPPLNIDLSPRRGAEASPRNRTPDHWLPRNRGSPAPSRGQQSVVSKRVAYSRDRNDDESESQELSLSEEEPSHSGNHLTSAKSTKRTVVRAERSGNGSSRLVARREQRGSGNGGLSWFEQLLPECLLNATAPITGYESRLESDVEDDEYEILERQRMKRNKRVRRRLVAFILIGAAVSAFMYSQGRWFRRPSVRATAMSGLQRLESGLSKSIKETIGK